MHILLKKLTFVIFLFSTSLILFSCKADVSTIYKDIVISFLGDSITELCKNNGGYIQMLNSVYEFKKVNNYGISGTTVSNDSRNDAFYKDYRVNNIDSETDILFIYGGINDCNCDYTIGSVEISNKDCNTFFGAYNVLICKLNEKFNLKIVLIVPHHTSLGEKFDGYANAIIDLAKSLQIDYIDLYNESEINESNYNDYTIDGIHLNYDGNKVVSNAIVDFFKNNDL